MPERRHPALGVPLLLAGLLLAGAAWFDGVPGIAAACAWLAQAPAALGIALLRGTRGKAGLGHDVLQLALLWAGGFALIGVLAAWPLLRLLDAPSLGAVLLLSAVAGIVLILLWRHWPAWHALEREGGTLAVRFKAQDAQDRDAWRGLLQVALPAFLLLACGLLLGWPGLLTGEARIIAAVAFAVLVAVAHLVLQAAPKLALLHGLPVVEMEADEDDAAEVEAEAASLPVAASPVIELDVAVLNRDLYAAARNGRVERALNLLEAGADPNAAPEVDARDRRSLPVLAALLPDLRLLRALIERGVNLNVVHAGMTPLLAATRDSWHGRPEAVMTLLANGADPRATDAEGNTPLHHAARSSDPGVAALLRDAGAQIDACNHDGVSPLGAACMVGNWRLARFLLENGARIEPENGRPALLSAAATEEDDAAGVQLLLRHKASDDARDENGRSALHEAASAGHAGICQALLDAGADANVSDAEGRTPLLDAARGGHLPVLETLLSGKADVHARDGHGMGALHLACTAEAPSVAMIRRLQELGVDPLATDALGRSAIDLASGMGRWTLVAALDPKRTLPVETETEDAPLPDRPPQLLLRQRLMDDAECKGCDALLPLLGRSDFDSLLCDEEVAASPARVGWLLRHGAYAEARVPGTTPPVQAALLRGGAGIETLHLLFAHGGSPAGAGWLARYLSACVAGHNNAGNNDASGERFAVELLERGADPFGTSPAGDPPLTLAVRLRWPQLLQRLLAHGVDPEACDGRGMGALHLAAALGDAEALKKLVAAGASPDRRAADGQTPLGVALAAGRRDLAAWLDWRGWKLPRRPLRGSDLPAAAVAGDIDAVRRLLDLGLPIDATDALGCTALLRAAGGGHRDLVELLLQRGANPAHAANTGATSLSAAVSMRHVEIVDRLLQAGAGLEQRLPGDVTVLMLAAALGLPELVTRLLRAGADLHAADANGLTPLHCAALYGFTARDRTRLLALLDAMLLAGADPHRVAGQGITPLLLLLGVRAEPGTPSTEDVLLAALERLLDEDVRLDARDARGFGPLHLAGLHGLPQVAQTLLREGADPNARDNLNRTPREIALMRGYVDVAAELTPPDAPPPSGVSMARFLRE
ncbi:MAG: ankyrin repeat domain-containing protein [Thermomonas sp.]|uniref:ankyrin repeat domain-containing protein n=1 Tax=Thermomonas sp. TaxID=1971895 RepID=UPI0039E6E993